MTIHWCNIRNQKFSSIHFKNIYYLVLLETTSLHNIFVGLLACGARPSVDRFGRKEETKIRLVDRGAPLDDSKGILGSLSLL